MKYKKLVQSVAPIVGLCSVLGGCATTDELYAKYEDVCELPKPEQVERIKIVKEIVEKERIVEKDRIVEKTKIVEKIKPVETIKYVDRIKPVETIKYVDRIKVVEKPKTVYKTKIVKQSVPMSGVVWEPAVYFGFDLATLTAAEVLRLDRDLAVLKQHGNLKVSLQSFTDSKGSTAYNRNLALQRQTTVLDYLLSKELARDRILVSPLGEELPILGESVNERTINRRVELMLLDDSGRPLSLTIQPKRSAFTAPFPVK